MPEELWTEVRDIVQEAVIKTILKKKKGKKAKWFSEEALQIAEKSRDWISKMGLGGSQSLIDSDVFLKGREPG